MGMTNIKLYSERVVSGLTRPLYVTAPIKERNRLFIVEQKSGAIKILDLKTGKVLDKPFITIPSEDLLKEGFEQGLLGLAFHPKYSQNGKFYVSYTAFGGGNAGQTKVVEYVVSESDPNKANPSTFRTILTIAQPQENHNGGWLGFGKDGYLYWSSGDGGGSGFRPGIKSESDNAQDITNNLLGKILRLNVNGDAFPTDDERNYKIPQSNPFVNKVGDDEIWAYGLRNPWRPSFDRLRGDLYIADVGQNQREEINFQPSSSQGGENYGWNRFEGTVFYKPGEIPTDVVNPIYEYDHSVGESVTGGYVYGGSVSQLRGTYFFADFRSSKIWSLRYKNGAVRELRERTRELAPLQENVSIDKIASFGEDAAGNLYIVDLDGEIFRLQVQKTIIGGNENDSLVGGATEDILKSFEGNDLLMGDAGRDRLIGGAGNDTLVGGTGIDLLRGGPGNDHFIFNSAKEGSDQLRDFDVTADTIVVKGSKFGGNLLAGGAIAEEQFLRGAVAGNSSHRFIYNPNNGRLFFDQDGAGVKESLLIAIVRANLSFTNDDIQVI